MEIRYGAFLIKKGIVGDVFRELKNEHGARLFLGAFVGGQLMKRFTRLYSISVGEWHSLKYLRVEVEGMVVERYHATVAC